MTLDFGPEEFTNARRQDGAADRKAADRDAALVALIQARSDFALDAAQLHQAGGRIAGQDSDRLEGIAERLVCFVDALESTFERLDIARECSERGGQTLVVSRSRWDRSALAEALCEGLQGLLSSPACAVLSAAVRLEARR